MTEFPPHTAITYFDAENGVDGAMVTASTLPGSAGQGAIGANSFFRYDAATPIWGRQGYHVAASTGEILGSAPSVRSVSPRDSSRPGSVSAGCKPRQRADLLSSTAVRSARR